MPAADRPAGDYNADNRRQEDLGALLMPGSVSISEPLLAVRAKGAIEMLIAVAGIALAAASTPAVAEKPLRDYSFIRGVNHGMQGDQALLERDLGYAINAVHLMNALGCE